MGKDKGQSKGKGKNGKPKNGKNPAEAALVIEQVSHAVRASHRFQFGALPWRLNEAGVLEVLLVTSRTTRRWIIPKGWPMGTLPPHKVAAQEAAEEAGVEGRAAKRPVGTYDYDKVLAHGAVTRCTVAVFALEVKKQKSIWPERKHRERRWLALEEAAALVGDAELAPLIRTFVPSPRKPEATGPEAGNSVTAD